MQNVKNPIDKFLKKRSGFSLILIFILFLLVGSALSTPAAASSINANRELSNESVYPGDSFTVTVNIKAIEDLEAPALDENLPADWNVTPVNKDGAVFREKTQEWLWTEKLAAEETKTVVYKVTVPSDAELKTYGISGEASAHSFPAVPIEGDFEIKVITPINNPTENKGSSTGKEGKSSGGGSGGGGGGAGSPEPNSNIELKEIANRQIFKGAHASYSFRAENNDITSVEFDPKKSFGKTTAIVEMLNETSALARNTPPDEVYRNVNIWVGNSGFSSPENLENAKISFRVSWKWIEKMGIDISTITLMHFSDERWNPLPTKKLSEDGEYSYFEAETPGFSPFAITGRVKSVQVPESVAVKKDEIQTPIEVQELKEEAAKEEGKGEGNSATQTGDREEKPERTPGFEAVLVALCLLLCGAMKRNSR